jgi:hypothetical protein
MESHGKPLKAIEGLVTPWRGMEGHGTPLRAFEGHETPWRAKEQY